MNGHFNAEVGYIYYFIYLRNIDNLLIGFNDDYGISNKSSIIIMIIILYIRCDIGIEFFDIVISIFFM